MDFASIWDQLEHNIRLLPQSRLLLAALAAMAVGLLGSLVIRRVPAKLMTPRCSSSVRERLTVSTEIAR